MFLMLNMFVRLMNVERLIILLVSWIDLLSELMRVLDLIGMCWFLRLSIVEIFVVSLRLFLFVGFEL